MDAQTNTTRQSRASIKNPHEQAQELRTTAVERIADFTAAARHSRHHQMMSEIRHLYKRNISDSLACAIVALPGGSFRALREQFDKYRAPGRCTMIGGGKTSAD
ncbi:MAG: hypothetical protein JO189_06505 [Deltaproteobacteria bacterium]|nr:hypothetical protein [Deltaproteobacteria bacterium]